MAENLDFRGDTGTEVPETEGALFPRGPLFGWMVEWSLHHIASLDYWQRDLDIYRRR